MDSAEDSVVKNCDLYRQPRSLGHMQAGVGGAGDGSHEKIKNTIELSRSVLLYVYALALATTFEHIAGTRTQASFAASAGGVAGACGREVRSDIDNTGLGPGTTNGFPAEGYEPAEDAPT